MKTKKEAFLTGMLLWVIAAILTSGCSSNKDAITQAEKTMTVAQGGKTKAAKPDFAEIRKIMACGLLHLKQSLVIADKNNMISISNCPQFGSEDLCEIPIGSGQIRFEFDINLIDTCFPLFPYDSNEVLARDLTRARVIAKDDIDLSTKNALVIRFKSRRAGLAFIKRLNAHLHPCKRYDKDRLIRRPCVVSAAQT